MWFVLAMVALANGYSQPPNCPPASGPYVPPDCGPNEYFEVCPPECPLQRCSSLWSKFPCEPKKECCKPACRCIDGYLRDDETGVCVTVAQCMGQSSPCGVNEEEVECRTICPPQNCDISYTSYGCAENISCERGCDCIVDHLRNSSGICIPNSECPPPQGPSSPCGFNEEEVECRTICPPQNCDISYTSYSCVENISCERGCDCIVDHLRNSSGICIPNSECPPPQGPSSPCGVNEEEVECRTICPPQNCDISYTSYSCVENISCERGCDCIVDHLRNSSGICIPNSECPPPPIVVIDENPTTSCPTSSPSPPPTPAKCGPNEKEVQCKTICPPQSCKILYTEYSCQLPIPCIPGCDCIYNYLRNSSGDCIYKEECPPPEVVDENPDSSNSTQPEQGTTTPSNTYTSSSSSASSSSVMTSSASSQSKSASSSITQASTSSNVQSFSISQSSVSSNAQSSSSNTKSSSKATANSSKATSKSGSSIPRTPLPTKSTCDRNETYIPCEFGCPTNFCPVDDNRGIIGCSPPYPCPPGCSCNFNYKRKSREDPTCILAEECPPVTCTRPNEEFDSCPSSCLAEDCRDASTPPTVCNEFVSNCQPKCVCKKGYYRNESGFCVPPAQCETKCGANQTYAQCVTGCPNNYCPSSDYRGIFVCGPTYYCPPGCACRLGYRRISYIDDTCILAEDCPPVPCTRPNEKWNPCPSCLAEDCADVNNQPSTCNEFVHNCQPRCVCEDGFFRDKSDVCVPKDQCPGATITPSPPEDTNSTTTRTVNQCGKNETYVQCKVECPNSYCPTSDSRGILICDPPYPCPPGCVCELGYRRKSYDDKTCILAEECSPAPCTRPNEKWNPCPSCLAEDCADVNNQPSTCNELVHNCQPKCVCEDGFFRDKSDVCVPKDQCPEATVTPPPDCDNSTTAPPEIQCSTNETYVQCNVGCPNNRCPTSDSRGILICDLPYPCPPGCACELGYRRKSYDDKTCILAEECPPVPCTRPNEKWNPCPSCLAEDCADVNNQPSTCNEFVHNCQPRCVCEDGFFRDKSDVCVPKDQCLEATVTPPPDCDNSTTAPPEIQCSTNETYVQCNVGCPTNNCPTSDSRRILICDPPYPCPPGCVCELGYKRKSYDDKTCILAEECPPVPCTRPNEKWNPCPSCLAEDCRDVNNPPGTCNEIVHNCQPKCICDEGFYRNKSDVCVPANECEPQCPENQIYVPCKASCPYDYCPEDDSRSMIACDPPNPCTPGCICGLNHKKISYDNETCIVSSDCPPVDCTRPNEEWDPCPSPCLRESCRDVNDQPSTCNYLVLNCQPTCVCSKGHFRNENDVCVPAAECPPIVETTEAPKDDTTSTPTDEIICGANETEVYCTFQCPYNYCPKDDSRAIYACKPPRDCPSGCGCKLGYRRLSYDNDTCILAEDCPPVTCTRPNERWDPCPSGCLAEGCEDVNNQPSPPSQVASGGCTCNELVHNCQPKCVCNDGYFRNKSDICVPAADCADITD